MAQSNERVVNGIKTRVLHNKDYVEVSTRVQILHELRKAGEIKEFEMVESGPQQIGNQIFWRVSARIDGKLYIGNAEVKLDAPKNTPDGTNPICCAETSAFGRMLAFAGLGTVDSIASYDEIARGKPFTRVIEEAPTKQIVSAKPSLEDSLKSRLNGLFERAKRLELLTTPTAAGFLAFVSADVFGTPITHPNQLDAAKLDKIEAEIARRESEATQVA